MAIKITISKQMVPCDKQKTALVCLSPAKKSLATPMAAVHLYWCLGVGSDVMQSAVQFIQCHLSGKFS
jgi:hypothetical protein